jgi:hypothetical protein
MKGKKNFECGLQVVVVDEKLCRNTKELFERERKAREKRKKIKIGGVKVLNTNN